MQHFAACQYFGVRLRTNSLANQKGKQSRIKSNCHQIRNRTESYRRPCRKDAAALNRIGSDTLPGSNRIESNRCVAAGRANRIEPDCAGNSETPNRIEPNRDHGVTNRNRMGSGAARLWFPRRSWKLSLPSCCSDSDAPNQSCAAQT